MKPLSEEQLTHLESLVNSPVYGALKALFDGYREECMSQLVTEKNPQRIYEIQGRIAAINGMEALPRVRAQQLEAKRQKEQEKEEAEKKRVKNPRPGIRPSTPTV